MPIFIRRPFPTLIAILALVLVGPLRASKPAQTDTIEQAWTDATLYLFKDAHAGFRKAEGPESRLGEAALLLLQQPKTDANIESATLRLEELLGESIPLDIAAAARYLLGRIAHVHRSPADPAAAAAHYRRLIADAPGHFLSDQALVKLALLELTDPALSPEARVQRLDAYADDADRLPRASSRRDLHLLLANIALQHRLGDERMLRHYVAADAAGISSPTLHANVVVSIGELASRLGRVELARSAFERYLAEFSRDYRRALVREKLAALPPASSTPAPVPPETPSNAR